ncbi:TetR/AcrR family transcriptional regulator [Deinococcus hopiensis]|uniref:Transcriptional regulator, TetR family n=1 Tax=Deinococcus hopiensis KR-140 TaxID=695939 RepID=A0A1W1UAV7_9DEIO|nr:TetR/AcrR family transcriptional regulator [Deinococcus hopiensis]SMB78207.1 transcriptional regulator, TetR family [Deinococcus hopiensis KR-140]
MSSAPTRLDPRIKRTQHALQEAFEALMHEQGYAATTVSDITARADVNRATFYAHYAGKSELFAQVVARHFADVLDTYGSCRSGRSMADIQALLRAVCVFMAQVHADGRDQPCEMGLHVDRQVHAQLTAWLVTALHSSVQRPNSRVISKELTATLMANSMFAAALRWARSPTLSLDTYLAEVMVFIGAGLEATGYDP